MRTTAMEWLIAQPEPSDNDSPMMRVNIAVDNDRSRAKDWSLANSSSKGSERRPLLLDLLLHVI